MPTNRVLVFAFLTALSAQFAVSAQQPNLLLRDQDCGAAHILVAEVADMQVYASCSNADAGRMIKLTVMNASTRILRNFAIGFCGNPVIAVAGPRGWRSETSGGYVKWVAVNDVAEAVQDKMNGIAGLAVTLSTGWQLSGAVGVGWLDESGGDPDRGSAGGAVSSAITHGCDVVHQRRVR